MIQPDLYVDYEGFFPQYHSFYLQINKCIYDAKKRKKAYIASSICHNSPEGVQTQISTALCPGSF